MLCLSDCPAFLKVPDEEASQTKAFNLLWNSSTGAGLRGLSDPEASYLLAYLRSLHSGDCFPTLDC